MIKSKPKACKGSGKAIGYGCGNLSSNRKYGLGLDCGCYQKWLFGTYEGAAVLSKSIITGKKKADKKQRQETRKQKLDNKSIKQLTQEARKPFQKLIRIRDHGKKCICCDRPLPFNIGDYDAGHGFKAEVYTGLIFHPDNVHGQTVYCNKYEHGSEADYMEGLKERIGINRYNKIKAVKNTLKSYKWDRSKLIELKTYYNKELKLVEKGEKNINDVDLSIGIV